MDEEAGVEHADGLLNGLVVGLLDGLVDGHTYGQVGLALLTLPRLACLTCRQKSHLGGHGGRDEHVDEEARVGHADGLLDGLVVGLLDGLVDGHADGHVGLALLVVEKGI